MTKVINKKMIVKTMSGELEDFVKKELKNGVSEEVIKDKLVRTGWDEEEVEKALDAGFRSKRNSVFFTIFALITTILLVSTLIGYFLDFQIGDEGQVPSTQGFEDELEELSCEEVESDEKHDCYLDEIISNSFDCNSLTDELEQNFCFRALEEHLNN